MSDETNDAPAADVEDGAAEALADTAAADAPVTVEDLVAALEAVTAERDQHLADLQRVSAEFQNFRKQTEKRNSDFAAQAGSRVAEALLPCSMRATQRLSRESKGWSQSLVSCGASSNEPACR